MPTQELLQLHDGAACAQLVVNRVAVGVVLAMLVVKVVLVNGRRGILVRGERRHAGEIERLRVGRGQGGQEGRGKRGEEGKRKEAGGEETERRAKKATNPMDRLADLAGRLATTALERLIPKQQSTAHQHTVSPCRLA